jgi:hypothetical protein
MFVRISINRYLIRVTLKYFVTFRRIAIRARVDGYSGRFVDTEIN